MQARAQRSVEALEKLHGLTELHEFLYAFISSLAKRDQRIAKVEQSPTMPPGGMQFNPQMQGAMPPYGMPQPVVG